MAINKPTKPNVELPEKFGGIKTAYSESQIENGYEDGIPQIVDGGNINYEKDALFQKLKYIEAVADAVANTPPGKYLVVDKNNRFEYADSAVQSTQGNIGDIQYTIATQAPFGGVWCDGSYYSKSNAETLYQMLLDEKLEVTTTAQYENELSQNGQCAKFALDESNERFRVPTIQDIYIKAGNALNTSNYESESLPNIKGEQSLNLSENGMSSGSFYNNGRNSNEGVWEDGSKIATAPGSSGNTGERIYFNASRSSSVYKDGANVEVNHINLRAYVVIYTTKQEDVDMSEAIKSNNPFFLGQSIYSPSDPENASWLKSDGVFHSGLVYTGIYEWIIENVKKGTQDFKSDMAYAFSGNGLNVWFPVQNPVVGATGYSTTDGTPIGKVTAVDGSTLTINGTEVIYTGGGNGGSSLYTDYDFIANASNNTFRLPLLDGSEDICSNKYINLSLQASGEVYTAPANGWYYLRTNGNKNQDYIAIGRSDNSIANKCTLSTASSSTTIYTYLPVFRGNRVWITYNNPNQTVDSFHFVYAKGNGSLYYYIGDTTKDADIVNFNNLKLELDECVHKTGKETITDEKTFVNNQSGDYISRGGEGSIIIKNPNEDIGVIPSGVLDAGIEFVDKNGNFVGSVSHYKNSSNNGGILIRYRHKENDTVQEFGMRYRGETGEYFTAGPGCPAKELTSTTADSHPTIAQVNSRINSVMNSKMQFGQTGSVNYDASFSVTFPTPFSSNPKVFLEIYNTTNADAIVHHITAVSKTSFTAYNYRSEKNANGTRYAQWLAVA